MSHERVIKVLKENGETWPVENVAVSGQVWDMRMNEVVGELECKVTGEGLIEVRFPEMGIGRYIFAVNGVSDDGQMVRIIEGYIGYEGPEMVEDGVIEGKELLIYIDGERRRALFGRNKAWEEKYKLTQEVAGQLEAVDKKLERAEKLNESINNKLNEFVVPDESTGTWVVGGVDTGKPYQGGDGKDADEIKRYVVSSVYELPASGAAGNYYYVEKEATTATGWVFFVNSPGGNGDYLMTIGGTNIYINTSDTNLADTINAAQNQVTAIADSADERVITLLANKAGEAGNSIAISLGENVSREEISGGTLTGGQDAGLVPYAWVYRNGVGQWLAVSTTAEKISAEQATIAKYGSVRLTYSVNNSYSDVPTSNAVKQYVDGSVTNCAKVEELNEYATKKDVNGLATKTELEGLATKKELEKVATQVPANVVTSLFGKKIVELSETEYSLLDSYDKDTYYLTYAD